MAERRSRDYPTGFLMLLGASLAAYYLVQTFVAPYISSLLDPEREQHERARLQAKSHLDRLRSNRASDRRRIDRDGKSDEDSGLGQEPRYEDLKLNNYENVVATEMVSRADIPVGFKDIAGLDTIIEELKESVIYPLTMPHLYSHISLLLSPPSGVLLYGPPGCGKTMLAKALARESGASFINLHISTITEKWYGDSNKIVRAVFSLARKVEPAIIFIDEIDAVLGTRRSGEHEASGMVKAEFMTLWDGLTSSSASGTPARIVVLGATNRIQDIDDAILRRMPKRFAVSLPTKEERRKLLHLILQGTKQDPTDFDLDYVAEVMAGMSGSDIKEACRDAAMAPVREYLKRHNVHGTSARSLNPADFRGITTSDFFGSGPTSRDGNVIEVII